MKRHVVALVIALALLSLAIPAHAATQLVPPFQQGPKSGDAHTLVLTDPGSGTITIFQHNTRQAAAVHCVGDGPMGSLMVQHVLKEPVDSVSVRYVGAITMDNIILEVTTKGSRSGNLAHKDSTGMKINANNVIEVPFRDKKPEVGETLTILMGLKVHAGCLPHPTLLGAPGSRPVEAGRVHFTNVLIG